MSVVQQWNPPPSEFAKRIETLMHSIPDGKKGGKKDCQSVSYIVTNWPCNVICFSISCMVTSSIYPSFSTPYEWRFHQLPLTFKHLMNSGWINFPSLAKLMQLMIISFINLAKPSNIIYICMVALSTFPSSQTSYRWWYHPLTQAFKHLMNGGFVCVDDDAFGIQHQHVHRQPLGRHPQWMVCKNKLKRIMSLQ